MCPCPHGVIGVAVNNTDDIRDIPGQHQGPLVLSAEAAPLYRAFQSNLA